MQNNIEDYIAQLPEERQEVIQKIRTIFLKNLPEGFSEDFAYGMIAYVVPHALYPNGYHCDPKLALPFISVASQKNFIALYHMGIYMDKNLYDWFVSEYPKHVKSKLDMGKSCIRFKKINEIPYELIAALAAKMTREQWIACYESNLKIQ
jgi:uncharacterized protein YdhG (YjbR/CyaY superfamily)